MPPFGPGTRAVYGIPTVARSVPAIKGFSDGEGGGFFPYPYFISGVTKDSAGAALGSCGIVLLRTADNSIAALATSDASGNYLIVASPALQHYIVAYKAGSPDVAGTTVNTLVGS